MAHAKGGRSCQWLANVGDENCIECPRLEDFTGKDAGLFALADGDQRRPTKRREGGSAWVYMEVLL